MSEKILVVGGGMSYGEAVAGLGTLVGEPAEFMSKPESFKLALFTGGHDVTPSFYGDTSPKGMCNYSENRDKFERIIFRHASDHGIKMTGICRGLQFINVMAGGKLMHHLDGHAGYHHDLECQKDDKIRRVNTLHHQMVIPPKDAIIIGWSPTKLSDCYYGNGDKEVEWTGPEVEAVIYPKIGACGVQWHPEMMQSVDDGYIFFHDMVNAMLALDMPDFVNLYTGRIKKVKTAG